MPPPVPLNRQQKCTAQSIVSIFETSKARPAYGTATILADGAGISYGSHQSTDASGTLDLIVQRYIDRGGRLAAAVVPYLGTLKSNASSKVSPSNPPQSIRDLLALLREAGSDPVMQEVQDEIFDEEYWNPAVAVGVNAGLVLPLCYAVLYDTAIHSGPAAIAKMRGKFPQLPPSRGGDERQWCLAYIAARRSWLAGFTSSKGQKHADLVRRTVYRMDAFLALARADAWLLNLPLTVRTVTIDAAVCPC